jgi:ubiquinone/menaquinone biosynthesis C-methylase UbiE
MAERVLVVGAGSESEIGLALERVGDDGDVIVIDPSPVALAELEARIRDGRLWFLLGDTDVLPLPDAFVDLVLAADDDAPEAGRVLREQRG